MTQHFGRMCILVCITFMLAGCGLAAGPPPPFARGATPETAVQAYVIKQTPLGVAQGFSWLSTHPLTNGALVMYTTPQFGSDAPMFQVAWHDAQGWHTNDCCDGGGRKLIDS